MRSSLSRLLPCQDWTNAGGRYLRPFVTGALSGTPTTNGTFNFSLRVRDYRENAGGVTNAFTMTVAQPLPFSLQLSVSDAGANGQARFSLFGTTGQRQIVHASSNLSEWIPLATNLMATNFFRAAETNTSQHATRFYRAVVGP